MMNPKVEQFLLNAKTWKNEMQLLRTLVSENPELSEDFKWNHPCYTYQSSNVVLIHEFKNYCALLFFKGVLLNDEHKVLIQQTDNVQQARQWRFTHTDQILQSTTAIQAYITEAIEIEKSGLKIPSLPTAHYQIPTEFATKLNSDAVLKAAFSSLTPGRQRAYLLYFSSAKQAATREARIQKYLPKILAKKGLDD